MQIVMKDMTEAREKVLFKKSDEGPAGLCKFTRPCFGGVDCLLMDCLHFLSHRSLK